MSSEVHGHHPAVDPAAYDRLQPKTKQETFQKSR